MAPTHVITAGSVSRSLGSVGRRRAPERAGSPRERGRAEKERNENTANKYVVHLKEMKTQLKPKEDLPKKKQNKKGNRR